MNRERRQSVNPHEITELLRVAVLLTVLFVVFTTLIILEVAPCC